MQPPQPSSPFEKSKRKKRTPLTHADSPSKQGSPLQSLSNIQSRMRAYYIIFLNTSYSIVVYVRRERQRHSSALGCKENCFSLRFKVVRRLLDLLLPRLAVGKRRKRNYHPNSGLARGARRQCVRWAVIPSCDLLADERMRNQSAVSWIACTTMRFVLCFAYEAWHRKRSDGTADLESLAK